MWRASLLCTFALSAVFVLSNCGGNAGPAPAANTPTTPAATPTPPTTPPPTTPPPSGGGGSTGAVQLQETISGPSGSGTLAVNANGDVSIQVSGMEHGASFSWQFCPVTTSAQPCIDLGQQLITDNSGSGQLTFHFPKSGTWAGYFVGNSAPPGTRGAYGISTYDAALRPMSVDIQKMAGINGTAPDSTPQDPLTGGHVTVDNGVAHITVTGAAPMAMYDVILEGSGGSSSFGEGKLSTDGSGNGTADLKLSGDPGSLFRFARTGATGFITGFKVP